MLHIILVDDEPKAVKALEWELNENCEGIQVDATFTDPHKAIAYLKNNRPDCVFLDIEMPEMDGFEFLRHFKHRDFLVVFVTAYDNYAIKAIRENALDYLLKPIDTEALIETLDRVRFKKREKSSYDALEKVLLKNAPQRIPIPVDGKLIYLLPKEIIYCKSDGNYSRLYLSNNKSLFLSKKLKEMEELLPERLFFRIHNSYIINLAKVREYIKRDEYVVLENNIKLPVSRYRKSTFLDRI